MSRYRKHAASEKFASPRYLMTIVDADGKMLYGVFRKGSVAILEQTEIDTSTKTVMARIPWYRATWPGQLVLACQELERITGRKVEGKRLLSSI